MATVVGVAFKKAGKVYYFDPAAFQPEKGDFVVVETARGVELGEVVTGVKQVDDDDIVSPLKAIVRMGTKEDVDRVEDNKRKEVEAFGVAEQRILAHELEMKLVSVEYTFDLSKIIFYFTANGRVDFRELVKDLASIFKTRIELRQIGVRDEAKMIGGLGACGRPICCASFLGDFQPVSIKMAKEQNLLLNPTKISGLCGRLMCCLKYEQDGYEDAYKKVPKQGKEVMTPDGRGVVTQIKAIKELVSVRIGLPDHTSEVRDYDFSEVELARPLTAEEEEARKARAQEAERLAEQRAEQRAMRAAQKQQRARPPREPRQSMESYPLADADVSAPAAAASEDKPAAPKPRNRAPYRGRRGKPNPAGRPNQPKQ